MTNKERLAELQTWYEANKDKIQGVPVFIGNGINIEDAGKFFPAMMQTVANNIDSYNCKPYLCQLEIVRDILNNQK